jgi:hypothetical protein
MYRITFNFPNLPTGGEIAIAGLHVEGANGVPEYMKNGSTYDVTDEMEAVFRALHPVVAGPQDPDTVDNSLPGLFRDNPYVTVAGGDE